MTHKYSHDVLILGSGAAGLSLALQLADHCRVAVLSKGSLSEGATFYAQGGVSAVLDVYDSITSHVEDTLEAGAGLCHPDVVNFVVENGRSSVEWLADLGVPFTRLDNSDQSSDFHLTREGGHSHRRVIHADDATGRAIEITLEDAARNHPNIETYEFFLGIDLITSSRPGHSNRHCQGAYALNVKTNKVEVFKASSVVLATGGAGKAYLYTSNPDVSTGDGIAMAWRAGCTVANMEFIQFHPTCLFHPDAKSFLITEALRGEGGLLKLPDGERFMPAFDERAELAPRDIVARAIDSEMKRLGIDNVFLDITHKGEEFIRSHFPTVYSRCLELGIDITSKPIPVVPAAHYTCGGVQTDISGHTTIPGLYAIGEVACTGLHGANRMASNSLLECMVFARTCCEDILQKGFDDISNIDLPDWDESQVTDADEEIIVAHNWEELRRFMWDYVGIVRTNKRLQRAKHRIDMLKREIAEYYDNFRINNDLIELRNLVLVAELIVRSALRRQESRGLHYTRDYPEPNEQMANTDTLLSPGHISKE